MRGGGLSNGRPFRDITLFVALHFCPASDNRIISRRTASISIESAFSKLEAPAERFVENLWTTMDATTPTHHLRRIPQLFRPGNFCGFRPPEVGCVNGKCPKDRRLIWREICLGVASGVLPFRCSHTFVAAHCMPWGRAMLRHPMDPANAIVTAGTLVVGRPNRSGVEKWNKFASKSQHC